MNHKDMQHIDPHPKRRKAKDNPYTLHTVGMRNGTPKYYVSFKMTNDNHVCVAVKREVYEAMNQFELDDLRYLNEILSGGGQLNGCSVAVEEFDVKVAFQANNLFAQCRLRNVQHLRGLGIIPCLRQGNGVF